MSKRVQVKFCGMRSKAALNYAIELGVDYVGFVVDFPKSLRSITLKQFMDLAKWLKETKKDNFRIVAVTIDMPLSKIQTIVDSGLVDVIQLHGTESIDAVKKIKGVELWKAWNDKAKGDVLEMAKHVDRILLDSGNAMEKALNKSGKFDSYALYQKLNDKKVNDVMSGGIDSGNVKDYLLKLKPDIIDVSRGIEAGAGKKSKKKMKEFMKSVNSYYGK
jgi:phosphoribosylanthranilate isomerase